MLNVWLSQNQKGWEKINPKVEWIQLVSTTGAKCISN